MAGMRPGILDVRLCQVHAEEITNDDCQPIGVFKIGSGFCIGSQHLLICNIQICAEKCLFWNRDPWTTHIKC